MNKALKLPRPWIDHQFGDQVTDAAERLVPTVLNKKIAHIGGAADLRYQNSLGDRP